MSQIDIEIAALADQLEAEVPWKTVSSVLSHEGYIDLIETIHHLSPAAYAALVKDLVKSK
jgi:hypothetical protein